ncbi:hypothetical protein [Desulfovibrio sp. DV]|uniref:hypothetical protein n=1 Tax=Desulfovibrio sp. DV TaxID=1844708 RepID=UPI001588152A|nr:hypothetical protein [Desulfovibrio sp. DV]
MAVALAVGVYVLVVVFILRNKRHDGEKFPDVSTLPSARKANCPGAADLTRQRGTALELSAGKRPASAPRRLFKSRQSVIIRVLIVSNNVTIALNGQLKRATFKNATANHLKKSIHGLSSLQSIQKQK